MPDDPDQIMRQISLRIGELRQALGLSQQQLAARLGIPYQNIQRLERGDQNLTVRTLVRVATALDASLLDLLAPPGSGHPNRPPPP